MADNSRRYVVHGRMPLKRTPESGLFTTRFKEDAFFIEVTDRAMFFNEGARTEQSLQLPLYFVEAAYHQRKRLVESVGFSGAKGRLELFIQYALLPVLDPAILEKFRLDVLARAEAARTRLIGHDQQTALDLLLLDWCDEPVLLFEYDRGEFNLRVKTRVPAPAPPPGVARTKRGRLGYYREYEDLLCSKAGYYLVSAFEQLPFVQQVELTMLRMEAEPGSGLVVIDEEDEEKKRVEMSLRRFDPSSRPPEETPKERKARQQAERRQAAAEEKRQKALAKDEKVKAIGKREPDGFDQLFDGTLAHQSPLLSARVPRQGFMDLQKSKQSYSARRALELFQARLDTDEETATIREIEAYF